MTREEFFQKVCIALAGNPKFTEVAGDPQTINENIIHSAKELTRLVRVESEFDDWSVNTSLDGISKVIDRTTDERGFIIVRHPEQA